MTAAVKALADHIEAIGLGPALVGELARRGLTGEVHAGLEELRLVVREELLRSRSTAAPADGLLSVAEAARVAGVKPATIRGWARSGRLKTAGRAGCRWRIRREDLDAALRRSSVGTEDVDLDRAVGRLLKLDSTRRKRQSE